MRTVRAALWIGPVVATIGWGVTAAVFAAGASEVSASRELPDGVYLTLEDAVRSSCGWGSPRTGASVTGKPLRVGSREFENGIGTHAPCELVFEASGRYRWLSAWVGVSEEMVERGSVRVEVWLDGTKVHETGILRVKQEPVYFCLPLGGAKEVRIVGTDAGDGNAADHLCLGNLRFIAGAAKPPPDAPDPLTITPLDPVAGHVPERGVASIRPARRWEFALVSGNGEMGAMVFGHPTRETIVGNHCRLYLPLGSREKVPDLARYLSELRTIIREQGYGRAMDFFLARAKEQGFPGLIWTDPFHPGFFLKVTMPHRGPIRDYLRTQDFASGEVTVSWRDDDGLWKRRLFVSRTHGAIVLSIVGPGPGAVRCRLTPEPVRERRIASRLEVESGWATYQNDYRHGKGGFDTAIRIAARGGETSADGRAVRVVGADEVLVFSRIEARRAPLEGSEAWAFSPEHPDFAGGVETDLRPRIRRALAALPADYDSLLAAHARVHGELFGRVRLDVGGGEGLQASSEALLDAAARERRLSPALLEKMYDAGRYMFICSAGELPPNLQGIWTGTWTPSWSGDFTTDTNLQLAIKVGFGGNLLELMDGYFRLIEGVLPDWRLNARRYYGCRGLLAPTRMSNHGLMLHWGRWNGIWWTGGAAWLARYFTEAYHYSGDREFLARRVLPLLEEVVLFYEDFVVVDEATGTYEFIPSYSPESSDGITATMDVMLLREALTTLIEACEVLDRHEDRVPGWRAMLDRLPSYRINSDGALAEFVPEGHREYYRHRHLSHLHAAYEASGELTPEGTPEVWKAAQEATRRRIRSGGEASTHGRMHMALAAAYLRMAKEAWDRLEIMATRRSMYPSLICSHEPDQRIFNTDGNGSIPEIVHRMLVGSRPGTLDLLPALPEALPRGSIRGILGRGQLRIDRLAWDAPGGNIELELTSGRDQTVTLRVPGAEDLLEIRVEGAEIRSSPRGSKARELSLREARTTRVAIRYRPARG